VESELMSCLADTLTRTVAAEQCGIIQGDTVKRLRVAEVEDLRDANVDVENSAWTHKSAGHAFYAIDQASVGLRDDGLDRATEIEDRVGAR
jgi:hypothetical protein